MTVRRLVFLLVATASGTRVAGPAAMIANTVSGAVAYSGAGLAVVPLTSLPIRVERPSVRPAVR